MSAEISHWIDPPIEFDGKLCGKKFKIILLNSNNEKDDLIECIYDPQYVTRPWKVGNEKIEMAVEAG